MNFKDFPLDFMKQVRAATYELGMAKLPGLFLIEERNLNGDRCRKEIVSYYKEARAKQRQTHPTDGLEVVHI
jgi:hypothetical protein